MIRNHSGYIDPTVDKAFHHILDPKQGGRKHTKDEEADTISCKTPWQCIQYNTTPAWVNPKPYLGN